MITLGNYLMRSREGAKHCGGGLSPRLPRHCFCCRLERLLQCAQPVALEGTADADGDDGVAGAAPGFPRRGGKHGASFQSLLSLG
jgi:hypothetical protein